MTTSKNILQIHQLQKILKYTFGLVPIVAGVDKFFNLLTQWEHYLSPNLADILPFSPSVFMVMVGVIEIIAGIIVLTRTELGAYIVSAWLVLIALSLLFSGHYVDVAVRDLVMAIGAYVLANLTAIVHQTETRVVGN